MTTERIKQIQDQTAYPDSRSVYQALLQVWNECEQESNKVIEMMMGSIKEKYPDYNNTKP